MTATDDTPPGSHNSGSQDHDDAQSDQPLTRREALPLLAAIQARGGYVTTDQLVVEFGISSKEVSESVDVLEDAGELEVYELGRKTILALPGTDVWPGDVVEERR